MKKTIIFILSIFIGGQLIAQENISEPSNNIQTSNINNKNGKAILPVAGEYAFGMSAHPFINYIGNIFNNTVSNRLNFNDLSIYGKYYLSSKKAIKARISINNEYDVLRYYVQDDAAVFQDPLSRDKTEDKRNMNTSATGLNIAYQIYKGEGRIQAYYGVAVGAGYARVRSLYEYGNEITQTNQAPTFIYDWNNGLATNPFYILTERAKEIDNGITYNVTVGPVMGVEYFFAPKISAGLEASLFYSHVWSTQGNVKTERWENGNVREIDEEVSPGNLDRQVLTRGFGTNGGLFIFFHF